MSKDAALAKLLVTSTTSSATSDAVSMASTVAVAKLFASLGGGDITRAVAEISE